MISIKTKEEIEKMRAVNRMVGEILQILREAVEPGITTARLNDIAEKEARRRHARCAFKGYGGFPKSLCVSINEEVVHGIPSKKRVIREGDLVSLDFGLELGGFYGDSAVSVGAGSIDQDKERLMMVTREALYRGIEKAIPGNSLYDISEAIQTYVESQGFSIVRSYVGHGIGRHLHEEPEVPNFTVEKTKRIMLRVGMTLAIEPMVNAGTWEVVLLRDGWTAVTKDRKPSAHFEHTIAITENGPVILSEA